MWLALSWALSWASVIASAAPATTEQRIEAAAREQLAEQASRAGWVEPVFEITVVKGSRPTPVCSAPVEVEAIEVRSPSRMRFAAVCPGAEGWRFEAVVRAIVSAKVLVSAVDLPSGRPLAEADLTLERRNITATPDALSELPSAVGMASRRAIRTGDVVRKSALAVAVLVRRGDAVRISAHSGSVQVTVGGEALEAGGRGDVIQVRNVANGSVIRARVTAFGTVEPAEMDVSTPRHSLD